jgi:periplasmic divalent cation tolerance protein
MSAKPRFQIVLVTAPGLTVGRKLARLVLEARCAACVNIVPKVESHYWWQGKITKSTEVMLVMKTTRSRTKALKRIILENHPYDTPEFVALPTSSGSRRYLEWVAESVRPSGHE